jgi:serine/threonine-protein kinase
MHQRTLPTGTVLRNRYELHATLGQGGMGTVYQAYDRFRKRTIALKQLHSHLTPETSEQLLQELAIQEQLQHPGVVRTYDADYDEATQTTFFTMALVTGPSLEDILRCFAKHQHYPPLSPDTLIDLMSRWLSVFEAIHQQGVVHGDIKASHILFRQDGMSAPNTPEECLSWLQQPIQLIDFGLARPITWSVLPTGGHGTPSCMAPEQWQGKQTLTPATDMYALGMLLFRLATGAPHTGGQLPAPSEWLRLHGLQGHPVPFATHIDSIVARALAYLPSARYQTAADMAGALQQTTPSDKTKTVTTQATPAVVAPSAKKLDLSGSPVSIETLEALVETHALHTLDLSETGIRDAHLVYLASLRALVSLQLADNNITGQGLPHLYGLSKLQKLSLAHNPLSSDATEHLASFAGLQWLSLWGCPLNHSQLMPLAQLSKLKVLHISDTGIGDAAVDLLSGMTQLDELALYNNPISQRGIDTLNQRLPTCRILSHHSSV